MPTPEPHSKLVALMSKPTKPELSRIVPEIVEWLKGRGYQIIADRETSNYCKGLESVTRDEIASYPVRFVVL